MLCKFFCKKTCGVAATLANKAAFTNGKMSKKELAEELHKLIIKKFKKRKV